MISALGKIVDEDDAPNYIVMIEMKQETQFLILGKQKFYFVDSQLHDSSTSEK